MKFNFASIFLFTILIINLIDLSFAKKKELQSILLGFLLGNTSHRNNGPQLIPHMMPHPGQYQNGGHHGWTAYEVNGGGSSSGGLDIATLAALLLLKR